MKKTVKLTENDINRLVDKILNEENLPKREIDRRESNFRRTSFDPYEREKGLKGVFGSYGEEIPPAVLQYMRKNPSLIIRRLVKLYGREEILKYI